MNLLKLDGAGYFRIFSRLYYLLSNRMLAVQALWAFYGDLFGDFMLAKFLLRTPENQTVAVGLQTFISDVTNQRVLFCCWGNFDCTTDLSIILLFTKELCYRPDIWREQKDRSRGIMQTFPLNYFSALRTPTQSVCGRKLLSWPKFFFWIFVFLVSFDGHACDPSFYANQIQAIPLEQFLSVHSLIDEQGTKKFSELELSETVTIIATNDSCDP